MTPGEDDSFVDPADGCPTCGERHTDRLLWQDDEQVRCTMCGTVYTPGSAEDSQQSRR